MYIPVEATGAKNINNAQKKGITDERHIRPPGTYLEVYSGAGVATASPARPVAVVAGLGLILIALFNVNAPIGCLLEAKSARQAAAFSRKYRRVQC
jgi:hypothetical protein